METFPLITLQTRLMAAGDRFAAGPDDDKCPARITRRKSIHYRLMRQLMNADDDIMTCRPLHK